MISYQDTSAGGGNRSLTGALWARLTESLRAATVRDAD